MWPFRIFVKVHIISANFAVIKGIISATVLIKADKKAKEKMENIRQFYKEKMIDTSKHFIVKSVHPSPLSAHRGFFGSKPFSKTNAFLVSKGIEPIDWRIQ